MPKYGYIKAEITEKDYIFGDAQLGGEILQPTGQWADFLPPDEMQNRGFETWACATFGTLNCIEILLRRRYTQIEDYSDRYVARCTGTDTQHGNSPQTIAEFLREQGTPFEKDWPFNYAVTTFEKFYETPPSYLAAFAERFLDEFDFGHDYVPTDPASLKEALKYSPLGISVFAWTQDENGLYYTPDGTSNNHWCTLYGYEDGTSWHIFDSYDNSHKILRWDFKFEVSKRYHVTRTIKSQQQLSLLQQILLKIQAYLTSLFH